MKKYTLANFCEKDKSAIKSYCAIHGVDESINLGDITKVNEKELDNFDLQVWGFPCTSISRAGKCNGFFDSNGDKTQSGLYYDGVRILKEKKPKLTIIENVSDLLSKGKEFEFNTILSDLNDLGYNTYYKLMCAKDYNIPQNRNRIFIVGIRKDIDNGKFEFPKQVGLLSNINTYFEHAVPKNYNLSEDIIDKLVVSKNSDGIHIKQATKQGWISCPYGKIADFSFPTSKTRRGRVQSNGELCPTLTATKTGACLVERDRIRHLTTLECWRLMGFRDQDYYNAKNVGTSESNLYKQAGNSIVTTVPYYIFKELYKVLPDIFNGLKVLVYLVV